MARKIKRLLDRWKYTILSISFILVFIVMSFFIRERIYKNALIKADLAASNVAMSNISIVKGIFNNYYNKLLAFQAFSHIPTPTEEERLRVLKDMKAKDSTIYECWSYQNGDILVGSDKYVESYRLSFLESAKKNKGIYVAGPYTTSSGEKVICMSVEINNSNGEYKCITIELDLFKIHTEISLRKDLKLAYITVVTDDMKYLFHPDEKRIGELALVETDWYNMRKSILEERVFSDKIYSDYLEMEIYRYYYPVRITDDSQWIITANVPNFGFIEFINETGRYISILAIVALLGFVIIFLIGIASWRKEFVSRKETEKENLVLQLKNEQQNKQTISAELENLKSSLNPHFLFNSLSSLMILVKKDTSLAKDFAISLSNLYRYMLEHEKNNTVFVKDELEFTENYVFLQEIRFKDRLFVEINVNYNIVKSKLPPVSIQLLVENAIKHNQITKSNPLLIKVYSKENMLVVENNITVLKSNIESTGKGQKSLSLRYSLLCDRLCFFYEKEGRYFAEIPIL